MTEPHDDHQWRSLWDALGLVEDVERTHLELGLLGEYAALLIANGSQAAASAFPLVAQHLETGCVPCTEELQELLEILDRDRQQGTGWGSRV